MSKSGNRKSRSNEGFILYQNNAGKTVQTSWRPQLPLPKEVVPPTTSADPSTRSSEMNRHNTTANHSSGSGHKKDSYQSAPQISSSGNKKWSFGRLFRKKKDETESSSEEDRKAGFVVSPKYRKKDKKKRGSKLIGGGFDHIVVSPTRDNEFFLPFEPVPAVEARPTTHLSPPMGYEPHSRSTHSLDRRSRRDRKKAGATDAQVRHSSSEEEMVSLNSSTTFARYRSDESLGSGGNGNGGQSRRSRAARNERYYKRLSRDGEVSHGQVPVMYAPQPAQRWKTQPVPLSVYNAQISQAPPPATSQKARPQYPPQGSHDLRARNSASLSHMAPHVPLTYGMTQTPKNLQNTVNDGKRSISYDSHIHLQNLKKPMPPPPPPRDPLRRVNVTGHNDHRPISYAFDQSSSHTPAYTGMSGRCVSDDRIWAANAPLYQSASSLNNPPPSTASSQNRRFITRAERDAHPAKKSLPSGLDFRYVAEATPRSRKPIHLFNQDEEKPVNPPSPVVIRTTKSGLPGPAQSAQQSNQSNPQLSSEFWRRGRDHQPRPESMFNKPRSVSSSRVGELRSHNMPMYSEVSKPKAKQVTTDEVDHVVSGSLLIKPSKDNQTNYVEIRNNNANKSSSMPNHYQRRDLATHRSVPKADSPTPNKYEEYVAEKRARNLLDQPLKMAPDPPQRKVLTKQLTLPPEPDVIMRKKPTNLEDAISELEAIYKSLKLGDESLLDRAERRDIPTPTNFEKYAETHSGEYLDDDDEPTAEPDVVRDDFAYRNIKHANLAIRASEKQPPFGIPIGPIAPSPKTDYLHVTPEKDSHKVRTAPFKYPDIVCDDMAVRTLRKDPPGQVKPQFAYPAGSLKKKRATRTQSANIYTLIQRNAAKPSGGDMNEFLELTKSLERAGSMSNIHETDDIPSTLQLLRNLREQEQGSPKVIPFRHPSQGGAICSLPTVLTKAEEQQSVKLPIPLPRKSLSPDPEKTKMEDALNKIAKEAKESSEKLTRELMELRKEALITSSRPKVNKPSIERDLEQIEAVSEAAKRCRHILMDTIPPDDSKDDETPKQNPPRRLVSEDKLIKAIDQVSDAANKVCEKILNEIVTVEPPVIVQNAIEVKNRPKQELVMPSLIQKLDPSSARIGEIAERCMRQISELNDPPDYDNLQPQPLQTTACNTTINDTAPEKRSDADLLIVPGTGNKAENEEEIDKIMKECEEQARGEVSTTVEDANDAFVRVKTANTTSASSSSDCLKSSSPSAGPHLSSSITSFNPYSSSDYIKSPSSEFHAPSTDPIKTFSTTSYDVQSSSVTPNITNSPFSYTPSPPLNLTPVGSSGGEKGERSGSVSQYNSSEELAMIFGIEKSSPATTTTGKEDDGEEVVVDCTVPSPAVGVYRCSEPNKPDVLPVCVATTTTTATNPEFCESVLVCNLDTIVEDHELPSPRQVSRLYVPSYASNVSIIVTSVVDDTDAAEGSSQAQDSGRQFDSLSSIEESSNPDSGNVSLSDFPVQSPVNASLEVELAHNSRFGVPKNFVNEVIIDGGSTEMDYLRAIFAKDEQSTSFSIDDDQSITEDQSITGDQSSQAKEQNSPGQLLHEVLSQVSRINAESNRQNLISQLENISECTKIVEDLSDRLSHHCHEPILKNREECRERGTHRVRFSDDCDSDHAEDQSAYLRSLEMIGHDLSSSEESLPPLGEIFNVPITDSENEDSDSETDRSPRHDQSAALSFNFDEMQRSFEEECNTLKEALHKVVLSGLIGINCNGYGTMEDQSCLESIEETRRVSPKVVSVIEVVDSGPKSYLDDPQLRTLLSEDESLTVSSDIVSIVEVKDSDREDDLCDQQLSSLLSESPRLTSDVVSIVEVVDSDGLADCRLRPFYSEVSDAIDDASLPQVLHSNSQSKESQIMNSESYDSEDVVVVHSDDESPFHDAGIISRPHLSPVNISLKIVNRVSKVSFVTDDDPRQPLLGAAEDSLEATPSSYQELFTQTAEIIVVDSENESYSSFEEGLSRGFSRDKSSETSKRFEYETDIVERIDRKFPPRVLTFSVSDSSSDAQLFEKEAVVSEPASLSSPNTSRGTSPEPHFSKAFEASVSKIIDAEVFGSQESLEIVYEEPMLTSEEFDEVLETEASKKLSKRSSSSSEGSIKLDLQDCDQGLSRDSNPLPLLRYRPSSSPADTTPTQDPTTPTVSKSLSLLAQPRYEDNMTTLEHVLLACTFGVVSGNDLITMLAIIIGVLTIIAIVFL